MAARLVTLLLLGLMGLMQAQLWLGRGSMSHVEQMREELAETVASNLQAQLRNEQLRNELRDLQEGLEIIEEKARMELGMVKPNEIFVQVVEPAQANP